MTIYDNGKNKEMGATTWVYTQKFHPFTDLTKEGVEGAWILAERCYDWLEENQDHGNPGTVKNEGKVARAQLVAVTFFPGKKGGYSAALNARSTGSDKARTDIDKNAPALKQAIGPVISQPIHAETLSWLMGEKTFRPELTDKRGREKHYPLGTITVVYGRRGSDYTIEDEAIKVDCDGKPVLSSTAPKKPERIEACATSNPRMASCRKIARELGVTLP